jgi:hypothetical protein
MTRILAAGLIAAGSLLVGSSGSMAGPVSGAVINEAVSEIGIAEAVHCRRFVHRHVWGVHRCNRAGVVIREGVHVRTGVVRSRTGVGVNVRTREGFRSGTTVRSREGTTIRSRTGSEGTTIRGGAGAESRSGGRAIERSGAPGRRIDGGGAGGTTGAGGAGGGTGGVGGGGAGAGGGGGAGGAGGAGGGGGAR